MVYYTTIVQITRIMISDSSMADATVAEPAKDSYLGSNVRSVHVSDLVIHDPESLNECLCSFVRLRISRSRINFICLQNSGFHVAEEPFNSKMLRKIVRSLTILINWSVCLIEEFESGESTLDLLIEFECHLDVTGKGSKRKR
ncbi:hypothetical protein PMAYCL1PPCAC_18699, partial [Pristionchus mayeri]